MATKTEPQKLQANWSKFERRPTWSVVTSRELSEVFGVHLQTINNWNIRGILPPPVRHRQLQGNKNYYSICAIRSWLEGRSEDEINLEWARQYMDKNIQSVEAAKQFAQIGWDLYDIERPKPRII